MITASIFDEESEKHWASVVDLAEALSAAHVDPNGDRDSPPIFPPHCGIPSSDPQRNHSVLSTDSAAPDHGLGGGSVSKSNPLTENEGHTTTDGDRHLHRGSDGDGTAGAGLKGGPFGVHPKQEAGLQVSSDPYVVGVTLRHMGEELKNAMAQLRDALEDNFVTFFEHMSANHDKELALWRPKAGGAVQEVAGRGPKLHSGTTSKSGFTIDAVPGPGGKRGAPTAGLSYLYPGSSGAAFVCGGVGSDAAMPSPAFTTSPAGSVVSQASQQQLAQLHAAMASSNALTQQSSALMAATSPGSVALTPSMPVPKPPPRLSPSQLRQLQGVMSSGYSATANSAAQRLMAKQGVPLQETEEADTDPEHGPKITDLSYMKNAVVNSSTAGLKKHRSHSTGSLQSAGGTPRMSPAATPEQAQPGVLQQSTGLTANDTLRSAKEGAGSTSARAKSPRRGGATAAQVLQNQQLITALAGDALHTWLHVQVEGLMATTGASRAAVYLRSSVNEYVTQVMTLPAVSAATGFSGAASMGAPLSTTKRGRKQPQASGSKSPRARSLEKKGGVDKGAMSSSTASMAMSFFPQLPQYTVADFPTDIALASGNTIGTVVATNIGITIDNTDGTKDASTFAVSTGVGSMRPVQDGTSQIYGQFTGAVSPGGLNTSVVGAGGNGPVGGAMYRTIEATSAAKRHGMTVQSKAAMRPPGSERQEQAERESRGPITSNAQSRQLKVRNAIVFPLRGGAGDGCIGCVVIADKQAAGRPQPAFDETDEHRAWAFAASCEAAFTVYAPASFHKMQPRVEAMAPFLRSMSRLTAPTEAAPDHVLGTLRLDTLGVAPAKATRTLMLRVHTSRDAVSAKEMVSAAALVPGAQTVPGIQSPESPARSGVYTSPGHSPGSPRELSMTTKTSPGPQSLTGTASKPSFAPNRGSPPQRRLTNPSTMTKPPQSAIDAAAGMGKVLTDEDVLDSVAPYIRNLEGLWRRSLDDVTALRSECSRWESQCDAHKAKIVDLEVAFRDLHHRFKITEHDLNKIRRTVPSALQQLYDDNDNGVARTPSSPGEIDGGTKSPTARRIKGESRGRAVVSATPTSSRSGTARSAKAPIGLLEDSRSKSQTPRGGVKKTTGKQTAASPTNSALVAAGVVAASVPAPPPARVEALEDDDETVDEHTRTVARVKANGTDEAVKGKTAKKWEAATRPSEDHIKSIKHTAMTVDLNAVYAKLASTSTANAVSGRAPTDGSVDSDDDVVRYPVSYSDSVPAVASARQEVVAAGPGSIDAALKSQARKVPVPPRQPAGSTGAKGTTGCEFPPISSARGRDVGMAAERKRTDDVFSLMTRSQHPAGGSAKPPATQPTATQAPANQGTGARIPLPSTLHGSVPASTGTNASGTGGPHPPRAAQGGKAALQTSSSVNGSVAGPVAEGGPTASRAVSLPPSGTVVSPSHLTQPGAVLNRAVLYGSDKSGAGNWGSAKAEIARQVEHHHNTHHQVGGQPQHDQVKRAPASFGGGFMSPRDAKLGGGKIQRSEKTSSKPDAGQEVAKKTFAETVHRGGPSAPAAPTAGEGEEVGDGDGYTRIDSGKSVEAPCEKPPSAGRTGSPVTGFTSQDEVGAGPSGASAPPSPRDEAVKQDAGPDSEPGQEPVADDVEKPAATKKKSVAEEVMVLSERASGQGPTLLPRGSAGPDVSTAKENPAPEEPEKASNRTEDMKDEAAPASGEKASASGDRPAANRGPFDEGVTTTLKATVTPPDENPARRASSTSRGGTPRDGAAGPPSDGSRRGSRRVSSLGVEGETRSTALRRESAAVRLAAQAAAGSPERKERFEEFHAVSTDLTDGVDAEQQFISTAAQRGQDEAGRAKSSPTRKAGSRRGSNVSASGPTRRRPSNSSALLTPPNAGPEKTAASSTDAPEHEPTQPPPKPPAGTAPPRMASQHHPQTSPRRRTSLVTGASPAGAGPAPPDARSASSSPSRGDSSSRSKTRTNEVPPRSSTVTLDFGVAGHRPTGGQGQPSGQRASAATNRGRGRGSPSVVRGSTVSLGKDAGASAPSGGAQRSGSYDDPTREQRHDHFVGRSKAPMRRQSSNKPRLPSLPAGVGSGQGVTKEQSGPYSARF